jgi:hypothetical protein
MGKSQMEKEGTITVTYDLKGKINEVICPNGERLTKPTGNLAKQPLSGDLIGTFDLGELLIFREPDGTVKRYCHIRRTCDYW